ncbi:hypothetical protein [Aureispira sp. CCB-E]|uniref:hypothetical protein n=1 Tax=Aureispira sp. CCB-E TaxID=3051121 RepID=UPI00286925B8|nr:hypothetical protein [Aureispira sp. CCB-E]WMX13137.1 hypothetical protein QP953_20045 [Aureispira sp. CCB-E]
MKRSYYSNSISKFIQESEPSILGKLNSHYKLQNLILAQTNAWKEQIKILKNLLTEYKTGQL